MQSQALKDNGAHAASRTQPVAEGKARGGVADALLAEYAENKSRTVPERPNIAP